MNKFIIATIVLILVIAAAYLIFFNNAQAPSNLTQQQDQIQATVRESSQSSQTYEIIYANSGYQPQNLTIKAGDTVKFVNQSSSTVWTASGVHPTHAVYSGTTLQEHCPTDSSVAFDECGSSQPGESWSFTFEKQGTWPYHNHSSAGHTGKIIVQ